MNFGKCKKLQKTSPEELKWNEKAFLHQGMVLEVVDLTLRQVAVAIPMVVAETEEVTGEVVETEIEVEETKEEVEEITTVEVAVAVTIGEVPQ